VDILFHGFSGLVISKALTGKYLKTSLFYAILPDLLEKIFLTYFKLKHAGPKSLNSIFGDWLNLKEPQDQLFNWRRLADRMGHSLFLIPLIGLLTFVAFRVYWLILVLVYLSHLVFDILTHEGDYAVRPLFPLSNWHMEGRNWLKNKQVWFGLWLALLIIWLLSG